MSAPTKSTSILMKMIAPVIIVLGDPYCQLTCVCVWIVSNRDLYETADGASIGDVVDDVT